jgi:hypothetical protein
MAKPAKPIGRIALTFTKDRARKDEDKLRAHLSVAAWDGGSLWVASDETAQLERLSPRGRKGGFGTHAQFSLAEALAKPSALPDGAMGEVDIEGIDIVDDCLWVAGSHSLARRRPQNQTDLPAKVRAGPNRLLLARLPLKADRAGRWRPVTGAGAALPIRKPAGKGGRPSNALSRALAKDEHVRRFMDVPAKENGFDIEGLVVNGERLWLGLRGPVLRGSAIILEVAVKDGGRGTLALLPVGADGAFYRKRFLDLGGLGIRDLAWRGDDLLILAGPTMDLSGPMTVFRWREARSDDAPVVAPPALKPLLELPHGPKVGRAEGIALWQAAKGPKRLLVVYDGPGEKRLDGKHGVAADLFALP